MSEYARVACPGCGVTLDEVRLDVVADQHEWRVRCPLCERDYVVRTTCFTNRYSTHTRRLASAYVTCAAEQHVWENHPSAMWDGWRCCRICGSNTYVHKPGLVAGNTPWPQAVSTTPTAAAKQQSRKQR